MKLLLIALVAVASTACQSAPPPSPVDCPALIAEFAEVSGVHDYFVGREGELGPNASEAFDQMMAINATVQESCND